MTYPTKIRQKDHAALTEQLVASLRRMDYAISILKSPVAGQEHLSAIYQARQASVEAATWERAIYALAHTPPSDSYLYRLYRKLPSHGAPIAVWTPVDITNSPNMALAFLAAENPYSSYPREAAPRKVVRSDGTTMVISDDADERTLAAKETKT